MSLLCLDLDNTLIDRTGAFRAWASGFVDRHGIDPHEVGWIMEIDLDGFARRSAVFEAIGARFGLDLPVADLVADYRASVAAQVTAMPGCLDALAAASDRGWHPWLVTNGEVEVQRSKLAATGLDRLLDGWVISEEAGIAKPNDGIFDLCASRAGLPLDGAWMIGDNGPVDIAGAHNAGIRSVWLHRNRDWDQPHYAPTHQAATISDALELIGVPTP
jgi:putative hydrolase of the HAD superfamily